MIWASTVWIENYEEIEDVVPRRWINTEKKILFWPSGISYHRAVNDEMDADETWDKYKLIKIKFESEYQHMMFKMVSKILENQELIIAVNKQPHSNLTVKQLETIAEYKDFLKYLEDDSVRLGLVKQLSFLGAKDYKQLIRLVMNRLFTNTLLAQFNLKGSGGKIGLLSTKLYDVLEELKEYCRQSTINLLGDELIHYFI
nr:uncharacterized protein LOC124817748 isoform X2 [Hydra vulgaris]